MLQQLRLPGPTARLAWILLLASALLLRLAVPAGWMPVSGADGTYLTICDGMAPQDSSAHTGMGAHHKALDHRGHDSGHDRGDHPCVYAGLGLALDAARLPVAVLPAALAVLIQSRPHILASVGQGLAAPPPPSTGPPSST